MTTQSRAIELTKLNIHDIFGERDVVRRLEVLADNWVVSGDSLFVDFLHVCKTHEAISVVIHKLQRSSGPEDTSVELSEVECLKHDQESDTWVRRLKWGEGSEGGPPRVTGWDVVTVVGGKIQACCTSLDNQ